MNVDDEFEDSNSRLSLECAAVNTLSLIPEAYDYQLALALTTSNLYNPKVATSGSSEVMATKQARYRVKMKAQDIILLWI